jgi:hypothetical protein
MLKARFCPRSPARGSLPGWQSIFVPGVERDLQTVTARSIHLQACWAETDSGIPTWLAMTTSRPFNKWHPGLPSNLRFLA